MFRHSVLFIFGNTIFILLENTDTKSMVPLKMNIGTSVYQNLLSTTDIIKF